MKPPDEMAALDRMDAILDEMERNRDGQVRRQARRLRECLDVLAPEDDSEKPLALRRGFE